MGRPLSKKYFGNRNVGADGTYATGSTLTVGAEVGGQAISGIGSITAGSFTGAQADAATLTFPSPLIADGVTATGTPNFKVLTATISGTQTRAYPVAAGALSLGSNSATSTYTATVTTAALGSVIYASASTISFSTTTNAMISGTSIVISGASITGSMTIGGVALAAGQTYYVGAPTTATAATLYATYAKAVAGNSGDILAISNGTTTGATFTFGTIYGSVTAVTVVNGGAVAKGAVATYAAATAPSTTDNSGTGLLITPATFGLTSATMTAKGSGYATATSGQSYTVTIGSNQSAAASATPAADTGAVGSVTNRENAIVAYAYISGTGLVEVDIQKQQSTKRYRVNANTEEARTGTRMARIRYDAEADGTAGYTAAEGIELNIVATDSAGGTYLVRKLWNRTCTLQPMAITRLSSSAGSQFTANTKVKWTFGTATANVTVQIENA